MYVGHSLLALALTGALARRAGLRRSRALLAGFAAAGFALVPDVDTAYTLYVVLQVGPSNVFPTTQYVWTGEGWVVHRALTHSLLTGAVGAITAATAALAYAHRHRRRSSVTLLAVIVLLGTLGVLVLTGYSSDGGLGVVTMGLYVLGLLAVATVAARRGLAPRHVGGAAAVGLLTHPFGDVFMGRPPAFLYPIVTAPPVEKVTIAADPTVNLVALFALELALAWAALRVVASLSDWNLGDGLARRAVLGVGFAGAVAFIRPPTLQVAYHFAIGTIATGAVIGVGAGPVLGTERRRRTDALVTGLAAVTLAVVGYFLAYLAFG